MTPELFETIRQLHVDIENKERRLRDVQTCFDLPGFQRNAPFTRSIKAAVIKQLEIEIDEMKARYATL